VKKGTEVDEVPPQGGASCITSNEPLFFALLLCFARVALIQFSEETDPRLKADK
jgi:hypothetical protein